MTDQVVPVTLFATFLNAPCTALRLARSNPESPIYLVVGKANGETIFFPIDRSECVSKFENEAKLPISAIAIGDLRNGGRSEVVTVTASGWLASLSFPCVAQAGPVRLFFQQLYPNICSAEVLDIDGDGLIELVLVMTDRVVRSYRYVEELAKLIPLNKWEMPAHISGWAIGFSSSCFAILSQCEELHYVRLDFGPTKEVRVLQSGNIDEEKGCYSPPITQLVIPKHSFAIHLLHSMVQRILLVDGDSEVEFDNRNGADIACICATTAGSVLRIVVTVDSWGQLNVYAWRNEDRLSKAREPVATCRVIRDADHICCCAGPGLNEERLFIGVVNIFNRIAIFSIDLGHLMHGR